MKYLRWALHFSSVQWYFNHLTWAIFIFFTFHGDILHLGFTLHTSWNISSFSFLSIFLWNIFYFILFFSGKFKSWTVVIYICLNKDIIHQYFLPLWSPSRWWSRVIITFIKPFTFKPLWWSQIMVTGKFQNEWMNIYSAYKNSTQNFACSQCQIHTVYTFKLSQAKTTRGQNENKGCILPFWTPASLILSDMWPHQAVGHWHQAPRLCGGDHGRILWLPSNHECSGRWGWCCLHFWGKDNHFPPQGEWFPPFVFSTG